MSDQTPTRAAMSPEHARALVQTFYRVAVGRARIARAEATLGVTLLDVMRDDDLVVIFAEELARTR